MSKLVRGGAGGNAPLVEVDTSAEYCRSDKIVDYFVKSIGALPFEGFALTNCNAKSWTGSRVGIIALKAWAWALDKPVFENGKQIDIHELQPFYNAEFKIDCKQGGCGGERPTSCQ